MTTHIEQVVTYRPQLKIGVGGNYYVISTDKANVDAICVLIKKERNSIYFHKKYHCWTIRIKNKKQKQSLRELFDYLNKSPTI